MFSVKPFLIVSPMNVTKIQKKCKYDEHELSAILPYRAEYISATIGERLIILKRDILPKMFNHWQSLGKEYSAKASKAVTKV